MRLAVSRQAAGQPRHLGGLRVADQQRPAGTRLDEHDAAQDQRTHDQFTHLGFGHEQGPQPLRNDQQCLDFAPRAPIDERRLAGELAHFGQEPAWAFQRYRQVMAQPVAARHHHLAAEHHEHAGAGLAGFEQVIAVVPALSIAQRQQVFDLHC